MAQPWATWTDKQWADNANDYHSTRLSADAWAALGATKQSQALNSARTQLAGWIDNKNYPLAVYEQALWLTTAEGTNSINDYASASVGTGSVSISYGRSRGTGGPPAWMSPLSWALLQESITGTWGVGRVV